jgi:hypothetical protein
LFASCFDWSLEFVQVRGKVADGRILDAANRHNLRRPVCLKAITRQGLEGALNLTDWSKVYNIKDVSSKAVPKDI